MSKAKPKKKQNGGKDTANMEVNELRVKIKWSSGGVQSNFKGVSSSPGGDVVILAAPAPVLVGEAVHLHILVWGHGWHSTEVLRVRKPGPDRNEWQEFTESSALDLMWNGDATSHWLSHNHLLSWRPQKWVINNWSSREMCNLWKIPDLGPDPQRQARSGKLQNLLQWVFAVAISATLPSYRRRTFAIIICRYKNAQNWAPNKWKTHFLEKWESKWRSDRLLIPWATYRQTGRCRRK